MVSRQVALRIIVSVLPLVILACQLASVLPGASSPSPTPRPVATRTPPVAIRPTTVAPPTAAPEPTSVPASEPLTATATDNLRIRSTPSTSGAVIGQLKQGETVQVMGRNAASDWVQIVLPSNPNQRGWISAQFATLSSAIENLPVVQPGATNPSGPVGPSGPVVPTGPVVPPQQPPPGTYPYPYP